MTPRHISSEEPSPEVMYTALGKIRDWLPVHYAFSWFDALATTIDYSVMIRGGSYCFIAGTVLYALAINRFAHKDVTS